MVLIVSLPRKPIAVSIDPFKKLAHGFRRRMAAALFRDLARDECFHSMVPLPTVFPDFSQSPRLDLLLRRQPTMLPFKPRLAEQLLLGSVHDGSKSQGTPRQQHWKTSLNQEIVHVWTGYICPSTRLKSHRRRQLSKWAPLSFSIPHCFPPSSPLCRFLGLFLEPPIGGGGPGKDPTQSKRPPNSRNFT